MSLTMNIAPATTSLSLSNAFATPPRLATSDEQIFTLDELIKRRAAEMGDAPLLGCPKSGVVDFEEHSARAVDRYVDAAVQRLQQLGLGPVDPSLDKPPVIGILSQSGLHFIMTILALNRLGYTAFLISTRLACPAICQLLDLGNCATILTTPAFHDVLSEVQQQRELSLLPMLEHTDYYGVDAPKFTRSYDPEHETKKVAVIIHSSGSTGLPKPIYLTNSSTIGASTAHMDMRAFICSPFFHSHGFYEIFRSIYSRKPLYFCNHAYPLTRQNVMDMLQTVKPELFHCVPYIVKLLAETDEGIEALAKVRVILFGGSSCPDDLGDRLTEKGVFLAGNYGATETGRLMNSMREDGDKTWNYLRCLPKVKKYVFMDEISPGIYECVALDGLKSKSTTNSDDPPGSFRTRDLFTRHPTRHDLWKYVSRLDDRFTLINGEKVLPIPMEGRIRQEQIVKEAVVFGEAKTYPGVLIVKADRVANMPDDQFLEAIWPAVESANSRAESFSQIPKELVVVLPADTVYPKTDKGTFIRVPVYRQFDAEIQRAYENFENHSGGSLLLAGEELESWLLKQLEDKSGIQLESAEADFFASGVDSLQCIKIWSVMKSELDLGGHQAQLGQNVLYETGNVRQLARHVEGLRAGTLDAAADELQKMEDLVAKYSTFPAHVAGSVARPEKDVVLLTGVTGGLGAHMLAQLVEQPNVSSVWAMVRAADDEAAWERVAKSLHTRGLSLTPAQRSKVVPLACDLGSPDLGIGEARLSELRTKLTHVIHSAWAVNFNIPVQSFEAQHIKAVHNLISLCASVQTPEAARFFFCSSVSSAGGSPRPGTVDEGPVPSPAYAQKTGYARSKYVAEHVTLNAKKNAGLPTRVLRIGQLVGDSKVGEWNATEGVPMTIQTAVTLGALPALDEEMTWLPVDLAASTILELAGVDNDSQAESASDAADDVVYHVLNPTRFHWTRQMLPSLAAAGLKFETLPPSEWMERLRNSDKDPAKNPPIKLLDWFEGKYGHTANKAQKGALVYQTEQSQRRSSTLRNVPDVTGVPFVTMMIARLGRHWGQ